jgi:hypothetical protein
VPTRLPPALIPLAVVVGLAAWCTRGLLDVVPAPGGAMRVAALPPLVTLVPNVLLALAASAAWLALVTRWRRLRLLRLGAAEPVREHAPEALLLPLYVSGVMVLPYLPYLPDVVAPLRAFAGPLAGVLWSVLVAFVGVISLWWIRRGDVGATPARTRAPWLFVVAVLVITAAAYRVTRGPIHPSGDEPHYLIIAQSLWRDGDLRIQNNHDRGDYREYYGRDLAPHFLIRGKDQQVYSIHPIALPLLIAPMYAAGGYPLVLVALICAGAWASVLAWRFTRDLTGDARTATLAWFAITFSVPFVFNAFSVYPEIVGALCVMLAFTTGVPGAGRAGGSRPWWVAGVCLAVLPWLATKYAFMTAALAIVLLGRAVHEGRAGRASPDWRLVGARAVAVLAPGAVSFVGWIAFFQWIWGVPSPAAPYGAMMQTSPRYLPAGALGLLFDQEYGLLAYIPALIVAVPGAWRMWRHGGTPRRVAWEAALVFGGLVAASGAFRLWWGDASPGRPVAAGLLLWALPVSWYVRESTERPGARAWAWCLALAGVALTVVAVWVQSGMLVASTRDGLSRLLQWLGGSHALWAAAPSFIATGWPLALAVVLVWAALAALATWWLSRRAPAGAEPNHGAAGLRAGLAMCVALVVAAASVPVLFDGRLPSPAPAGAAARSPLLDEFSTTARPTAVRYEPFAPISVEEMLSLVRFVATPGLRRDPQPVAVLHNMRLTLPAGRYRVALAFEPLPTGPHTLGLRVGRIGPVYRRFDVPATGGSWQGEFELPIDANFVGFEASRDLAPLVRRIEVTPLAVVDLSRRIAVGQVLAARTYPGGDLFAHDEQSWIEADGAWTAGRRTAAFTFVPRPGTPPLVRLYVGPRTDTVELSGTGWQRRVEVGPDQRVDVPVPRTDPSKPIALRVRTAGGFVPADRDPATQDRRFIGAYLVFP